MKPRVVVIKRLDDWQGIRPLRYPHHPAETKVKTEKRRGGKKKHRAQNTIKIITWYLTQYYFIFWLEIQQKMVYILIIVIIPIVKWFGKYSLLFFFLEIQQKMVYILVIVIIPIVKWSSKLSTLQMKCASSHYFFFLLLLFFIVVSCNFI